MKTLAIVAACLFAAVVILGLLLYGIMFIIRFAHTEREVIDVTVVAIGTKYAIVRDSKDALYITDAKNLSVDEEIVVEILKDRSGKTKEEQDATQLKRYIVSQESGAKKAKILRRLTPKFVLCQWKEKQLVVSCTLDEQTFSQEPIQMVVGFEGDRDTHRSLRCENVMHLPVVFSGEPLDLPMCRRI